MDSTKFEWYINRLKLMSFGEVVFRVNGVLKTKQEKISANKLIKLPVTYNKLNKYYFSNPDYIRNFYSSNGNLKQSLINKADQILDHKFSFFALQEKDFGIEIDWHKDYLSGKSCKPEYYTQIDYKDYEEIGDIKYVWELNRFQHFYPLSQAFILTQDAKYAREILYQINDWIDKNPYLYGVNWTSSLELAIRLISWGWAIYSLEICGFTIGENLKRKISSSIFQQAQFIYNHMSAYSSANNHLIGEAAGLAITGALFDFGRNSVKWREKGYKTLLREIENQIFEDGLNKEQTLAYHCFVFDFFLLSFLILEKNGTSIANEIWKKIEKMAEIITYFCDEDLNLPNIGDADDGYVIKLANDNHKSIIKSLLNTSAILFNRGDFKHISKNILDEKTLWLLGSESIERFSKIEPIKPDKKSIYLKDSGYVILNDDKVHSIIDVAPLGYLSIAAHGHADALAMTLTYNNKEVLVDTGTYAYHTKKEWREYFRGTSAHNTLEIDGKNQSVTGGNFMWLKKADTTVQEIELTEYYDYIRASHNGYVKQYINVEHQREILFQKNKHIIIIDNILNNDNRAHNYSLYWHLNENCMPYSELNDIKITNSNDQINLKFFCDHDFNTEIIYGSQNPILGWTSRNFDKKIPTNVIKVSSSSDKNLKFITVIFFGDNTNKATYSENSLYIWNEEERYNYNLINNLNKGL